MVLNEIPVNEQLIKSKHRVKQHGEVFTPQWMIDQMLEIPGIKEAVETVSATFLEPAAGDGNFLVAIVERKLQALSDLNLGEETERESLWALASVYGIELLEDNHELAQARVLLTYLKWWEAEFGKPLKASDDYYRSAEYIIQKNIVHGNTLEYKNLDTGGPIIFYEWLREESPETVGYKRFKLEDLTKDDDPQGELDLFGLEDELAFGDEAKSAVLSKIYLEDN